MGFEGVGNGGDRGLRITSETSRGERNRKALEISERLLFCLCTQHLYFIFFFKREKENKLINYFYYSFRETNRRQMA